VTRRDENIIGTAMVNSRGGINRAERPCEKLEPTLKYPVGSLVLWLKWTEGGEGKFRSMRELRSGMPGEGRKETFRETSSGGRRKRGARGGNKTEASRLTT